MCPAPTHFATQQGPTLTGLEQVEFWKDALKEPEFVYFIQQGESGPVKIGYAHDPLKRMGQLQTGNPNDLTLRQVVPGNRRLETNLHHRFRDARVRAEWFGLSYLEIIMLYAEGFAAENIRVYDGSGKPPVVAASHEERTVTGDQLHELYADIERLWLANMDYAEMAEIMGLTEHELRGHLREMRKSPYWDVQKRVRHGMQAKPPRWAA